MWDFVKGVLELLVPPHDADGEAVYRYRLMLSTVVVALVIALTLHIMLACGYLSGTIIGFPGFARADAVATVHDQLNQVEIVALDANIWRDMEQQCVAEAKSNGAELNLLAHRIQVELDNYERTAGHEYRRPSCQELGASG